MKVKARIVIPCFLLICGMVVQSTFGQVYPEVCGSGEAMKVDGNVGIGTATPAEKLDVFGKVRATGYKLKSALDNEIIQLGYDSKNPYGELSYLNMYEASNMRIRFNANYAGNSWINAGNVGIGTDMPTTKLDVAGTIKTAGFIFPTGAPAGYVLECDALGNATWQPAGGATSYWQPGSGSSIYTNDNVGIGTSNPASKLDVVGNITLDNYIYGAYGTIARSTDEWLRLNDGASHSYGILTPSHFRADGEIRQGGTDYGGYEIQTGGQMYTNDYLIAMGGVHVGGTSDPGTDNLIVDGEIRQGATDYGAFEIQTGGQMYTNDYLVAMGGVHVGGNSDPGTDNLIVDGNVGIGTTSPTTKLDVSGTIKTTGFQFPTGASTDYVLTCGTGGTATWQPAAVSTSYWQPGSGLDMIYSNHNVGIGTTSPGTELDVAGTITTSRIDATGYTGYVLKGAADNEVIKMGTDSKFPLQELSYLSLYEAANHRIRFTTNSAQNSWINAGNVGIGTDMPTTKLDVAGTIKTTGFYLPTGASTGHVLTCGSGGVATWQAPSGGSCAPCNGWNDDGANVITDFNVGIGMTSPAVPSSELEVKGMITSTPISANSYTGFIMKGGAGNDVIQMGTDSKHPLSELSYLSLYEAANHRIRFTANPAANSWINAGNVGIGTDLPATKLDVNGTITGTDLNITNNLTVTDKVEASGFTGYVLKGAAGNEVVKIGTDSKHPLQELSYLSLYEGTNHRIQLNANSAGNSWINAGNVGIGTDMPTSKLDVNGTITGTDLNITNNLTVSNKIEASGFTGYVLKGAAGNEVIKMGTDSKDPYSEHSYLYMYDNTGGSGVTNNICFQADPATNSWINAGNVGIGTDMPTAKLDVAGAIRQSGPNTSTILYHSTSESGNVAGNGDGFRIRYQNDFIAPDGDALVFEKTDGNGASPDGGIAFVNRGTSEIAQVAMFIKGNGNIGVGKTNPSEKLDVDGSVKATSFKVGDWTIERTPDYVFEKDYRLRSLKEVENYVEKHKHLPDVPSSQEMVKNGVDLADMNMTLLKKVEELTLYVIQQQKEIETLKTKVK